MHRFPLRLIAPALLLPALWGCGTTQSCGGDQEYLKAQERPRLQLPSDVLTSERVAPIVIPPLATDPQKLDPQPRCLDFPPPYFAKKPASATAGTAAEPKPDKP